ncbi:MAG: PQQ-binding-like beta-propeller repeat protein [Pseudomonadota bacterium]
MAKAVPTRAVTRVDKGKQGRFFQRHPTCRPSLALIGITLLAAAFSRAEVADPPGQALYAEHCATCHSLNLRGSAHGSTLRGNTFLNKWQDQNAAALLAYNQTNMPPGSAGSLKQEEHAAITAYIIAFNEAPATGNKHLFTSASALAITDTATADDANEPNWETWGGADTIEAAARARGGFVNQRLDTFSPISMQELSKPPPEDWLSWRRTLDGQAFSPLRQINRETVEELKLAWVMTMQEGSNQVTPLVHDGIMFLTHPGNLIQALDAASGELIWEYQYEFPETSRTLGGPTRNIAIFGDKLFLATYDAAIVAIDARSGEEVWRTEKANFEQGYTHTAGPIIGDGVVLSGINGCEWYKEDGCFITGHEADTGKELWRTSTIALPGAYGGDTWAGLPLEMRAGGDSWIAGSYDPQRKLFYIGTSQAKPWVAASRGMTPRDAALYTNSTLALNPRSGEMVWYFQHIPGETIDMEVGLERVLLDLNGTPIVVTIGKDGLLWKLDRETGEYLDVTETLPQTIYADIDKATGKVTYREDILSAKVGDSVTACPGIYGGHNWQATAYDPSSTTLFIPLHQLCTDMVGRAVEQVTGSGGYGGDSRTYEMPGVDGMLGRLAAWDVDTMTERWAHEQRALFMTGALATAGGLVFIGDVDRYFNAFDSENGKLLWRTRLGAPTHGYPITYSVDGKQYVAVPTGIGVFRAMTAVVSPQLYQPSGGEALYVFELP